MRKFIFSMVVVALGLVACNKNESALENAQVKQKAPKDIVYFNNVNKDVAEGAALTFFTDIKDNPKGVTVAELDSILDWEGKTAMYVFNLQPNGFVITSADVRNEPIVGYSAEGYFGKYKNAPDAIVFEFDERMILNRWLQDFPNENTYGKGENLPARMPIIQDNMNNWKDLCTLKKYQVDMEFWRDMRPLDPCAGGSEYLGEWSTTFGYYCQTSWDQEEPYNYYCPHQYHVGCVNVALAQIMRYHQHPNWVNWNVMPNSTTNSYNNMTAGDDALAHLLRNIGNNTNTTYKASGSSASDWMAAWVLEYKYSYDKALYKGDWNYDKIKNDIFAQKPVYISGDRKKGSGDGKIGHAYVIDGFKNIYKEYRNLMCDYRYTRTTELMHYNFGWGGSSNGWYSRSIKDLPDKDYERYDWDNFMNDYFPNYKYNKRCIYNIKPK